MEETKGCESTAKSLTTRKLLKASCSSFICPIHVTSVHNENKYFVCCVSDIHWFLEHELSFEPGFWEQNQVLACFCCGMCYIYCLTVQLSLVGESHAACHDHTNDLVILLWPQHWPDHNEIAMLYLGLFCETEHYCSACHEK